MIHSKDVERLGHALAELHVRYNTADLKKILQFAHQNRRKGGDTSNLAKLLEEFAQELRSPRRVQYRQTSSQKV